MEIFGLIQSLRRSRKAKRSVRLGSLLSHISNDADVSKKNVTRGEQLRCRVKYSEHYSSIQASHELKMI